MNNGHVKETVCPICGGVATDQPTSADNYRKLVCVGFFRVEPKKGARKTACKREFPYLVKE